MALDLDGTILDLQLNLDPRDVDALHRIIRAGIAFGPEVMPGETRTMHSRGLMALRRKGLLSGQDPQRLCERIDVPAGKGSEASGFRRSS